MKIGPNVELYDIAVTDEFGLGGGAFFYGNRAVGVYGTCFIGFGDGGGTPQDSDVILSPPHSNDPKIGERVVPWCVSGGLTYGFTDIMGIYVGATYGGVHTYEVYYDETQTLDPYGHYQIDAGAEEQWDLEYGIHLVAWGSTVIGIRRNLAIDKTFLTVSWGF